jgi:hypothetical protein
LLFELLRLPLLLLDFMPGIRNLFFDVETFCCLSDRYIICFGTDEGDRGICAVILELAPIARLVF